MKNLQHDVWAIYQVNKMFHLKVNEMQQSITMKMGDYYYFLKFPHENSTSIGTTIINS